MAVAVKRLIIPDILKSVRYLRNDRLAANKPWHTALIRWELTYPEAYEVGYSQLGHIILHHILNAQPQQLCYGQSYSCSDRSYLPDLNWAACRLLILRCLP